MINIKDLRIFPDKAGSVIYVWKSFCFLEDFCYQSPILSLWAIFAAFFISTVSRKVTSVLPLTILKQLYFYYVLNISSIFFLFAIPCYIQKHEEETEYNSISFRSNNTISTVVFHINYTELIILNKIQGVPY